MLSVSGYRKCLGGGGGVHTSSNAASSRSDPVQRSRELPAVLQERDGVPRVHRDPAVKHALRVRRARRHVIRTQPHHRGRPSLREEGEILRGHHRLDVDDGVGAEHRRADAGGELRGVDVVHRRRVLLVPHAAAHGKVLHVDRAPVRRRRRHDDLRDGLMQPLERLFGQRAKRSSQRRDVAHDVARGAAGLKHRHAHHRAVERVH
eukprot:31208-Pelagococcus_subviridis.AAC.4